MRNNGDEVMWTFTTVPAEVLMCTASRRKNKIVPIKRFCEMFSDVVIFLFNKNAFQ